MSESGFRHAFSSLRHRDFARVFWASTVSNTGGWMQTITVPFVIYDLTASRTWLGFAGFLAFFPGAVVGPIGGALADRFSRRRVLLVAQSFQMALAFVFWLLWVTGTATPASVLVTLFFSSVAAGVMLPVWQSFVPSLVPRESMLNAVRLNSVQFTAGRAVGPALGGLVLGTFGPGAAFMSNALSFLGVLVALAIVRPPIHHVDAEEGSLLRRFAVGVRYVRDRDGLKLAVLTVFVMAFLPNALVQLGPAFAEDQFGASSAGYGFLVAAYGTGSIIGSLGSAAHADRFRRSRLAMTGVLMAAFGMLLVGASGIYALGFTGFVVLGVAYVTTVVSLNTAIQVQVDEAFRGRALAVYLVALLTGLPFGALTLGALADGLGLRATSVMAATILVTYALVARLRFASFAPLDGAGPSPELIDVGVGAGDRVEERRRQPDVGQVL